MSYCYTLIKSPDEALSVFNNRLAKASQEPDNPITNFDVTVVSGQPVVTLISELVEATSEDVEGDADLTLGDLIPESEPMIVQTCQVEAATDELAKKSESRLEKIYRRFGGDVIRNVTAKGIVPIIVPVPDAKGAIIGHVAGTEEVLWAVVGIATEEEAKAGG